MSQKVVENLKNVLADSYALYLKTQNYHWNVKGPHFNSLHLLFEGQYQDLAASIDEIAELIRALGEIAPGTWKEYEALTVIKDGDATLSADEMVKDLAEDQEKIVKNSLQKTLDAAEEAGDDVVVDAMVGRMTVHRKNKWMLNSSIA